MVVFGYGESTTYCPDSRGADFTGTAGGGCVSVPDNARVTVSVALCTYGAAVVLADSTAAAPALYAPVATGAAALYALLATGAAAF